MDDLRKLIIYNAIGSKPIIIENRIAGRVGNAINIEYYNN